MKLELTAVNFNEGKTEYSATFRANGCSLFRVSKREEVRVTPIFQETRKGRKKQRGATAALRDAFPDGKLEDVVSLYVEGSIPDIRLWHIYQQRARGKLYGKVGFAYMRWDRPSDSIDRAVRKAELSRIYHGVEFFEDMTKEDALNHFKLMREPDCEV